MVDKSTHFTESYYMPDQLLTPITFLGDHRHSRSVLTGKNKGRARGYLAASTPFVEQLWDCTDLDGNSNS